MNLSNEIYASYKKPVPHSEIDPCLTMMYRFFVQLLAVKSNFHSVFWLFISFNIYSLIFVEYFLRVFIIKM